MTDEELAVIALRAWNAVPADYPFAWPKDFPEGSREAWKRVVTAIREAIASPSSNGRTPPFESGNKGSIPLGETSK